MNIICAKLTTGEEIIAKVANSLLTDSPSVSGTVTLEDVRIVAIQQVPGRGVGISFIPFTLANPETKVTIDLDKHAMCVYSPQKDLERAYIGESSSIALATPETAAKSGIHLS